MSILWVVYCFIPEKLWPGCSSAEDSMDNFSFCFLNEKFSPRLKNRNPTALFQSSDAHDVHWGGVCSMMALQRGRHPFFIPIQRNRALEQHPRIWSSAWPWLCCWYCIIAPHQASPFVYLAAALQYLQSYTNHIQQDLIRVRLDWHGMDVYIARCDEFIISNENK